jgi:hypothetical protein
LAREKELTRGQIWPRAGKFRQLSTSRDLQVGAHSSVGVQKSVREPDDSGGSIEDLFGQLWFVPAPSPPPRVSPRASLVWIERRLWEKGVFAAADCFPVSKSDVLSEKIWDLGQLPGRSRGKESKSYAEAVKAMVGFGRPWRQADHWGYEEEYWGNRPPLRFGGGRPPRGPGRDLRFQGRYPHPPPPPPPLQGRPQQHFRPRGEGAGKSGSSSVEGATKKSGSSSGGKTESSSTNKSTKVTCFNCGGVGHYSTGCDKPRACFICKKTDHGSSLCPEWKSPEQCAMYLGSGD